MIPITANTSRDGQSVFYWTAASSQHVPLSSREALSQGISPVATVGLAALGSSSYPGLTGSGATAR